MFLFKNDKYIKIKKFGELQPGDVFFHNNLPFIKFEVTDFGNAICLEDGIECYFKYNDEVEFQWCGYFRSHSYKRRKK